MHIALIEEANHIFRRISKELGGKTYDSRKTISADLPFAQNRWCEAAGLEQVQIFSDHINMSFGQLMVLT